MFLDFKKRGVALTELLILITVLAILIGLGIVAFRNYQPSLQLSGVSRDLASDLRYAQQLALTEQIKHGIRFATTTDEYQIIRYGEVEEVLQEKQLPQEVSFSEITGLDNDQAIFNPYGAVRQAGTVTLINTQAATTTIDIRPSGFVRIIK